ncbi:immunity 51 family protein [Christensenellaceae bacterium OttesenSCG-928-M15]|nr:immunity 51 family protein [Christensenellaceae bacterium OttesenSCG-928-M15]
MDFQQAIRPFFYVEHENTASICLNVGGYKDELFESREEEGFEGNGYDWGSLAFVFLAEKMPELLGKIAFDPEAGTFCAYSTDREAIKQFALGFKAACEDDDVIYDLFQKAELD